MMMMIFAALRVNLDAAIQRRYRWTIAGPIYPLGRKLVCLVHRLRGAGNAPGYEFLSAVREALSGFHSFGRFHNYYDRFRHSGVRKDEAQNEAR